MSVFEVKTHGKEPLTPGEVNRMQQGIADAHAELEAHLTDPTGAHAASTIANTPAGNVAATDVQGAINELDTEKAGVNLANQFTQPQTIQGAAPAFYLIDTTGGAKSARIQVDGNVLTIDEITAAGAFVAMRAKVDLATGAIYDGNGKKMATEAYAAAIAVALGG